MAQTGQKQPFLGPQMEKNDHRNTNSEYTYQEGPTIDKLAKMAMFGSQKLSKWSGKKTFVNKL